MFGIKLPRPDYDVTVPLLHLDKSWRTALQHPPCSMHNNYRRCKTGTPVTVRHTKTYLFTPPTTLSVIMYMKKKHSLVSKPYI